MIIIVYMTVFVVTLLSLQFCSARDEDVYVAFCELCLRVMLKVDVCFQYTFKRCNAGLVADMEGVGGVSKKLKHSTDSLCRDK